MPHTIGKASRKLLINVSNSWGCRNSVKRRPNSPQHSDRCRTESCHRMSGQPSCWREVLERRHGWFGSGNFEPSAPAPRSAGPNHPLFPASDAEHFLSSDFPLRPRENRSAPIMGSRRFLVLHDCSSTAQPLLPWPSNRTEAGSVNSAGLPSHMPMVLDVAHGMPIRDLLAAVLALLDLDHLAGRNRRRRHSPCLCRHRP